MKEKLLQELLNMPDICCIVGNGGAVSEGFVDPSTVEYSELDGWATIENGAWHIHFHWPSVQEVRFVEAPSICLGGKISYSINYLSEGDQPLVRFSISNLYDADGNMEQAKHEQYMALKAKYSGDG